MKKFKDLSLDELKEIVNGSEKLRKELDNYIQDTEMCWLSEKLDCVKSSLKDWCVGFFTNSYINVRNYDSFLDGVKKSIKSYGASKKLEKLVSHCEKLRGTNLFEHYAEKVEEVFFEEEFQPIIDFVEEASDELYCGKVGAKSEDYLECFFFSYEDYLFDEENKIFYEPHTVVA